MHSYFPKRGILIFRNGVSLFSETSVLLFSDYTSVGINLSMNGIDLMRIEYDKIKEVWLFSENIIEEDKFWTTLSKS